MMVQVELANVVATSEKNYFVAVQLEYNDQITAV